MLAPSVAARAAAVFAEGGDANEQRCPGEDACERFHFAAGSDQITKAVNACTGCPLLPTKISAPGQIHAAAAEWILDTVERVRRERDSGAGIDLNAIGSLGWELVQLWDQIERRHERDRADETRDLMLMLLDSTGNKN
jgi:hypothetical protein